MLPVWYARWKRSTRSSASSSSVCLVGRNLEILDADRDAAARRVGEAELLEPVEELHRRREARLAIRLEHELGQRLLLHVAVLDSRAPSGTIALNSTRPAVVFSQRLPCDVVHEEAAPRCGASTPVERELHLDLRHRR